MKNHNVQMVKTHDAGAEEWFCPICNRRFIVQWSPEYQFIALEAGDVDAIHNMGRGAMIVASEGAEERVEYLQPWVEFLNSLNLEARLGEKDHES